MGTACGPLDAVNGTRRRGICLMMKSLICMALVIIIVASARIVSSRIMKCESRQSNIAMYQKNIYLQDEGGTSMMGLLLKKTCSYDIYNEKEKKNKAETIIVKSAQDGPITDQPTKYGGKDTTKVDVLLTHLESAIIPTIILVLLGTTTQQTKQKPKQKKRRLRRSSKEGTPNQATPSSLNYLAHMRSRATPNGRATTSSNSQTQHGIKDMEMEIAPHLTQDTLTLNGPQRLDTTGPIPKLSICLASIVTLIQMYRCGRLRPNGLKPKNQNQTKTTQTQTQTKPKPKLPLPKPKSKPNARQRYLSASITYLFIACILFSLQPLCSGNTGLNTDYTDRR